jgi:hypothetical protein
LDDIVKKQIKIMIVVALVLVLVSVLFLNLFGLFRIGGYGLAEEGQHFKVGTTISVFHFQDLSPNTYHRFRMWHPTQNYPSDTPQWSYLFTSDGSGKRNWNINLYLNRYGEYYCNLDWKCDGDWCTVFGGGAIYSDAYQADIDITGFTINPSTVTVGDEVTVSWTVKNNGDFNGDFDWYMGNPWKCEYSRSDLGTGTDITLNMGGTYSDYLTFIVTDDMAHSTHPTEILIGFEVNFYGSNTQYPPDWGDTYNDDSRCEGITYIPPQIPPDLDITYTLTILTSPNNCDVNILGIEVINSGDNGIAMFEDVPYGPYTVMVSKAGYPSSTKTVFIDSDAVMSMDITSQKYLMPILFLASIIIFGVFVYYYRKKQQ